MRVLGLGGRSPRETRVAVVGSGLPAAAAALELARRGIAVAIVETQADAGEVAGLGLVVLGPPRPYPQVVAERGRETARLLWAVGRENHQRLRTILEESRRDCGHRARGSFLLAMDRQEAESLAEGEDMLREDGFPGEFLDHYMLETRFDVSGFAAGYWSADDGDVDLGQLVRLVHRAARERGAQALPGPLRALELGAGGVVVHTERAALRAERLVLATDRGAATLLPPLLDRLQPGAGTRVRFALRKGAVLPASARTADGRLAWQTSRGTLTLAGLGPGPASPEDLLDVLPERLPAAPGTIQRWIEPDEATLDGLPLVGPLEDPRVAVACGFGPLAASHAFAAAGWIADVVTSGRDPTPAPLRASRIQAPPRDPRAPALRGGRPGG